MPEILFYALDDHGKYVLLGRRALNPGEDVTLRFAGRTDFQCIAFDASIKVVSLPLLNATIRTGRSLEFPLDGIRWMISVLERTTELLEHLEADGSRTLRATHDTGDDALGQPCHVCTCTGFHPDPNDPTSCIAPRPPQGRCQHSYLSHF